MPDLTARVALYLSLCGACICQPAPRLYATLSSPRAHALYAVHHTKAPEYAIYSSGASGGGFSPGFACCRGFNLMAPYSDWTHTLDVFTNSSSAGGFGPQGLANIVWPGAGDALGGRWPELATLLAARGLPATDLGGFVPGGMQQYDAHAAPNFTRGAAIMGERFLGFDMGEQDVRYLWGYNDRTTSLVGPGARFERLVAFREFSDAIETRLALTLGALASSTYGVHHWLKTGFYTNAGAETSQSNGNAQVLYAFVRGAAKQYGVLWFGQVSIFNWFGYKIPGDPNPSNECNSQSDHSSTCGTSYSLMKRLMYSQLAYNSAYFAYEGGLVYEPLETRVTPIGAMQLAARAFFAAAASSASPGTPPLGVHVPAVALLFDSASGFARPCDSRPQRYTAGAWGTVPWDAADGLADAVLDTVWPGYRAGALFRNESGYIAPTPFGDAADVLLSDALPSVLTLYDTVVLAHRAETDAGDLARRLGAFLSGGGRVVATASTLADLGGLAGVAIGACAPAPAGTRIALAAGGSDIIEPRPLVLCAATPGPDGWEVLATVGGTPVAVRVRVNNGTLVAVLAGAYGMSTARDAGAPPLYGCGVDEPESRAAQPFIMTELARHFFESSLEAAAVFDLGRDLAWVPQREAEGSYVLTITNPTLVQAPLAIASRVGSIAWVEVLPLDSSEKNETGYLPHGFADAALGKTTNTTLAGGDTLVVRVMLASDATTVIPPVSPPTRASALAARRLLRLSPSAGDLRRAVLARPHFESLFGGLLVDWAYVASRAPTALAAEGAWLSARGIAVAVDFSRSTTLFPGLRLSDDLSGAFAESMAVFNDVLAKMPSLGAGDALLTLHGRAELAPTNFSAPGAYAASVTATLRALSEAGAASNVTFHLRRSQRNNDLAGASLGEQAAFAASASVAFAPSLAYSDGAMGSDAAAAAAALFGSGAARMLLLSAAWQGAAHAMEAAPLAPTLTPGSAPLAWLGTVHAAAEAARAWVVVDAAFDESVGGRAGALADARAIEDAVGAYA